jgi:muramoyltetrapeptide carboxypeptidase
MITPPFLKAGDKLAIVSPARCITFEEVYPAMKILQRWGLEVVLGTHVFSKSDQFAGTDEQRTRDLQHMLDDGSIRAILCARGGYGTVRTIDRLDFNEFTENPKWIIGYSDITVLHCHIQRHFGIETLHATMPVNMNEEASVESLESMRNVLFGTRITYALPRAPLCRTGRGEGPLTGGNLSILCSLMGSVSEPDTTGKILFLEDVDEYLYHIDRMMMTLKRAEKLDKLHGLIIGGMDRMNDNAVPFGKTANEIISEAVKEYGYPVCFGFPAGHGEKNLALVMGRNVKLTIGSRVEMEFS